MRGVRIKMKRKIFLVVGAVMIVAAILILVLNKNDMSIDTVDRVYEASESSGGIGEKLIGNPDAAKVVVYEYADYACAHCAEWNRKINELLDKYGDKIALVFRFYDLKLSSNSSLAAKAATAAQVQGYFEKYKDLLFGGQSEWMYVNNAKARELLVEYFEKVSDGKGDTDKFKKDLDSEAVRKRVNFEHRMGEKAGITGTPTFRIDGEKIELDELVNILEEKL